MSDVIRQGTKIRINELQNEALKKEAERKRIDKINHIMAKSFTEFKARYLNIISKLLPERV